MNRRIAALLGVLALILTSLLLGQGVARAADSNGQLLVLMDSSGSMAGPDGAGSTKIDAAKKAVTKVVDTASGDDHLGLRVYGADKGQTDPAACRDSRLLVPVSTVDKSRVDSAAAGMTPRGQTPIAYSLQQAAKDFRGDSPRTILLVSDGIETCHADPCAVAKTLEAQGIQLRIDVVGFRVDDAARSQLQCVARAGRGTYYDAQNGPSLQSHVERSSIRALREYRPSGTPIDGTSRPAGAPKLTPGQYVDSLPPVGAGQKSNTPLKHYTFDWKPGETVHLVATAIPPAEANRATKLSAQNGIGLAVTASDGSDCDSGTGMNTDVLGTGGGLQPVSTSITFPSDDEFDRCAEAGTFTLSVSNGIGSALKTASQLEIVMLAEPKVTNADSLPAATDDYFGQRGTLPAPAGTSPRVAGGADYADAPTLGSGSYTDTVRPGETLFYRTRLDWGQHLAYRVDLGELGSADVAKAGRSQPTVETSVDSPLRVDVSNEYSFDTARYTGDSLRLTGATIPVRWHNREAGVDLIKAASLAGYYYLVVHMDAESTDQSYQAPVTISLKAEGVPTGRPQYATSALTNPESQLDQTPSGSSGSAPARTASSRTTTVRNAADDSSTSTLTWVALGAGVVLILGGGAVAASLFRRR